MANHAIIIQSLHYAIQKRTIFNDLSLTFQNEKYGIIGNNGCGKSTLLKLIMAELTARHGTITTPRALGYLPQSSIPTNTNVAETLGIQLQLGALKRIEDGTAETGDFDTLDEQWDIREQAQAALLQFGLTAVDLNRPVHTFSGGQITRIRLAGSFMKKNAMLLLDEPSNHCDQYTRELLHNAIASDNRGIIIASHDRSLLNRMDCIIELTANGIVKTHGNYDQHHQQQRLNKAAAQQCLQNRQQALKKGMQSIQERVEKHQRAQAKGKKAKQAEIKAKGRYDKIGFKSQQGRSEKTNKKILTQATRMKHNLQTQLSDIESKITHQAHIKLSQLSTYVAQDKPIISINDLHFSYGDLAVFSGLNASIIGPQRVALIGGNGAGKSTLLKLILGELTPSHGNINVHVKRVAYIDQHTQRLNPNQTVLENFISNNPTVKLTDAYRHLDHFLFRAQRAKVPCNQLSGGERLRALLAMELMQQPTPQLLLLDEPSNHLDIESLEVIEQCLHDYNGALIIASHDQHFLDAIGINQRLHLPRHSN